MDSGARFVALSHQSSPWVEAQLALVEVVCPASARILEVGSGSGELASRLTANGYEVVALEPDPAMFEVLLERRRAITSQLHPLTPLPIPFQSFMPSLQFDAVLAMGVFSFLTPSEQLQFVEWAADRVSDGGVLILSAVYSGANETDSEWRTLASHELGIARLDIRARKCPPAGDSHTIEYEYAVVMDGDVLTREIVNQTLYLTEHQTLLRLLLQWGLEPKAVFADWNGSAFTPSDRSAIIVAESTARE